MEVASERAGIGAPVFFALPAHLVDRLIEELLGSSAEPARWFIFDTDLEAMGALNEVWQGTVDMALCRIPSASTGAVEAALDVLACEGVALDRCAWLSPIQSRLDGPDGVGFVLPIDVDIAHTMIVAGRLHDWLDEVER